MLADSGSFLTFCTEQRRPWFTDKDRVDLVRTQILRAARQHHMLLIAYCFMRDHVHLLVEGVCDDSDLRAFVKAAKQCSGYHFKQQYGARLWQRYCYERVLRADIERATTIRYIIDNPVNTGLVEEPEKYPFLGSECYTVAELIRQAAARP